MSKPFLFLFFFLILLVPVMAVKPVVQSGGLSFSEGLVIKYPPFSYVKQGEPFSFSFHVCNISNGVPVVEGLSCDFHLFNSSGEHVYEEVLSGVDDMDYTFNIMAGNFSELGSYGYLISCNDSLLGGYASVPFTVNLSGMEEENSYFLLLIFLLPVIFGFFTLLGSFFLGDDHKVLKIGLFLFSLVTFFASVWLAYIVVAMQFPHMDVLQNALGGLTWIFGIIITVIIVYFMLYILYKTFRQAAQEEKDKDLEY